MLSGLELLTLVHTSANWRASSYFMGALSWLNAETLEKAPLPSLAGLKGGHSFMRVQYT